MEIVCIRWIGTIVRITGDSRHPTLSGLAVINIRYEVFVGISRCSLIITDNGVIGLLSSLFQVTEGSVEMDVQIETFITEGIT